MNNAIPAAALSYAARGWHVLPLEPRGKKPLGKLVPHGLKDATTDADTIRAWWAAEPDANVGIATGHGGLVVVDVDNPKAAQALRDVVGDLPVTPSVVTSKGAHLYYWHPETIGNSPGGLPAGIDVRGLGGYVVAPPSVHPSGDVYTWDTEGNPARLPDALAQLLKADRARVAPSDGAPIPEGQRNTTATQIAGAMRRQGMDADAIYAGLKADRRLTLPDDELRTIADSVARYPAGDPEQEASDQWAARQTAKKTEQTQAERADLAAVEFDPNYVAPRRNWLWRPYLPLGALVVLDGDPGLGKSTVALDIAARVSRGSRMPDGADALFPNGTNVLIYTTEDDWDTIYTRLKAAGANLKRVHAWEESRLPRPLTIPDDLETIEREIEAHDAHLLILDPVLAMLSGQYNPNSNQEARAALQPLRTVMERRQCTGVMLRHLNKMGGQAAIYRGQASMGITGLARSVLLMAKDPDDPTARVMAHVKSNWAPDGDSRRLTIQNNETHHAGQVRWLGTSEHSADALVLQDLTRAPERAGAITFLTEYLKDGPKPYGDVKAEAEAQGLAWRTVERAAERLRIRHRRDGFGGKVQLQLPEAV